MSKLILVLLILASFTLAEAQEKTKIAVPLILNDSRSPEGAFNSRAIFLADQLFRNKSITPDKPVIITSFLDLENLKETNSIGRLVAEVLIHEMQIRNFRVIDFRLTEKLFLTEKSEAFLSRDPKKIKEKYDAGYILTGSYTKVRNGWFINARIIDLSNSEVISTGQALLSDDLFPPPPPQPRPLPTVSIAGVSQ